jgi:hypothetical protein
MAFGSFLRSAIVAGTFLSFAVPALASPWAEVGDNQLRSDVELLATAGVINGVTTHWPLPWKSLAMRLDGDALSGQPVAVRLAAERVLRRAQHETMPGVSASLFVDATNRPSVVYGFDGMGRGEGQAQGSVSFNEGIFAGRVSLGAFTQNFRGNTTKLMPDGSYLAATLGSTLVYAGYLDHWWGPGEISALSLSNNARPMPQIGIERSSTQASSWPVLRWLGPWQLEFMLGYLDGPRIQPDTYYNALRLVVNPLPGLELGVSRTEEFCGQGHNCSPIKDYFHFSNNPFSVNNTNDQLALDFKYNRVLAGVPFQIYTQIMDEDYSPIGHPVASHLFGASVFLPAGDNPLKLTAEYTDSVPTKTLFSFGDVLHGAAYNNSGYPDGMRYRGRTLGFSLDSDSTLLSLQGNWTDPGGRFYQLSLHHAAISNPLNLAGNAVTTAPVHVNMGEARITLPWRQFKLDIAGRLQDDQPRPHSGFAAGIEAALRVNL